MFFALVILSSVLNGAQRTDSEDRGSRSKSFTVSKGGRLEVSVRSGDVRVVPWNKNEVFVKAEGIDEEDLDRLTMTQLGNTVRVEFRPRGQRGPVGDILFEINTPSEFNVDLRTSGGNLDVTGPINGKIDGHTSGGNITLAEVIGTVGMSTSGGNIRTGDIKGNADLHTSGGDIELRRVDGETTVRTSGGNIRVESVGKRLEAKTSGGDIIIGDVGGEARVSTSGGDVRVGKVSGGASLKTAGGDIELRSASGTVDAKTAGGNIRLENISGSIEAKTAGGEIRAELVPSGKGTSELSTAGGNIKLYLPENAKAAIEATIRITERWFRFPGSHESYDIRSDFKSESYEKDEHASEIHAKYVLNGGGERIMLETVNSNIEIRKLRK